LPPRLVACGHAPSLNVWKKTYKINKKKQMILPLATGQVIIAKNTQIDETGILDQNRLKDNELKVYKLV
jgi:hypothetical protein